MKKVMFCSDPAWPLSTTGFGVVGGQLMKGLLGAGCFQVSHLARGLRPPYKNNPFKDSRIFVPPMHDPNGYGFICSAIREEEPDLLVFEADPGSILEWRRNPEVRAIPNLCHTATEGAPLLYPWDAEMAQVLIMGGRITTYTQFSKDTIDTAIHRVVNLDDFQSVKYPELEVLGLAMDHADFCPDPELREKTRRRLGWTDNFVVMNVARNCGRKNWPKLFKAIQILKPKYPEVLLYAHTVPFENFFLLGHDLFQIRRQLGVENEVVFKKDLEAYNGIPFEGEFEDGLTLKALYNAADLFVSPTSGEGFCMPIVEAAACGLPVATTQYAGGWEIAQAFGWGIPVPDYETDPHGLEFAKPVPADIAWAIEWAMQHPQECRIRSKKGLQTTAALKWRPTVDRFVEMAKEMCGV